MIECSCGNKDKQNFTGIEYPYDSPQRYDGVSEWVCNACGERRGRWTGKVLKGNELEPRWGGK